MAMDHTQPARRGGHSHNRGRRGPDRQNRARQQPAPTDQPARSDRVDVEHIMRDIRARISQRSGVDLSNQQIHELAARRLEAILDPRSLKPGLLDQLRRGAGERQPIPDGATTPPPLFEEVTLYDSPSGFLRFCRKILNPILRLFLNPTPIAHALAVQERMRAEAATRELERERRQTEWNALHFEIVQRLVTEVSRVSLELQSLALRVESLSARVDFTDRRVRSLDGTQPRAPRPQDSGSMPAAQPEPPSASVPAAIGTQPVTPPAADSAAAQPGDAPRRRRRRRRGRRGTGAGTTGPSDADTGGPARSGNAETDSGGDGKGDAAFDDEPAGDDARASEGGAETWSGTPAQDDAPPRSSEE